MTEPSKKVQDICNTYYPFDCKSCPIVNECFESQFKRDHIEIINQAAKDLNNKKN